MKVRLIFFAFLFLSFAKVSAQHYVPFPTDSAVWRIDHYQNCPPTSPMPAEILLYSIDGDTIINSINYKKLLNSGVSYCGHVDPYAGSFRDDTLARKVYFIHPDSISEALLYDFNLNAGDTIRGYYEYGGGTIVQAVDTILLGGILRKRMTIGNVVNQAPYFVEGIGNLTGLIEPYLDELDFAFLLTCFSQNGLIIYPDSTASCMLIDEILETKFSEKIVVAPNPFFDKTTISSPNGFINKIVVYNLLGEEVVAKFVESSSVCISLDELGEGIFLCKIFLGSGQVQLTKLLCTW